MLGKVVVNAVMPAMTLKLHITAFQWSFRQIPSQCVGKLYKDLDPRR